MELAQLRSHLLTMQDIPYRQFHGSLLPGVTNIIGVRVPLLRRCAKDILKNDWQAYLKAALPASDVYYEETVLQALVLAQAPMKLQQRLAAIRRFLPKLNNWAVCDIFCSALKEARKYPADYWQLLADCCRSQDTYTLRFAAVMLLNHFTGSDYAVQALQLLAGIRSEEYYVRMAAAWGISVFYVHWPELTLPLFTERRLEHFTHNMAIRKICESFRVSAEAKQQLRTLRLRALPVQSYRQV